MSSAKTTRPQKHRRSSADASISVVALAPDDARKHFLKGSSYFSLDLPHYLSMDPILSGVAKVLAGKPFNQFQKPKQKPEQLEGVNYQLISNKDGRFAWRPFESIHPVIYVALVNAICSPPNWKLIQDRFADFQRSIVGCCSVPVVSADGQSDKAKQVTSWWQKVEQESLKCSLEFSHVLHSDVVNCYGTLYTHSIAWAIHGKPAAKARKKDKALLGNMIDCHIRAGRYGQTNGIPQGSVLMDLLAELVLGYVDELIDKALPEKSGLRILRYRDDYRVFANTEEGAERALRVIADQLRSVGMQLGVAKTLSFRNVVEGSIKPDKLSGIGLQDLGRGYAKTIQKQLLRLHAFGQKYPNSGALRRLVSEFYDKVVVQRKAPDDLEVQIAIATDIAYRSPSTFPAVAGILSHLISLAPPGSKATLWEKVVAKMRRVPHNGFLEIWLQRVVQPLGKRLSFDSAEPICRIVDGEKAQLWDNSWIGSEALLRALDVKRIVLSDPSKVPEVVQPHEIKLFRDRAENY